MEIGLNLPVSPAATPAALKDIARRAEALGFAELYLGEHVVLFDRPVDDYPSSDDGKAFFPADTSLPDPLVAHAFIAAATEHIRLATGVMLLPQRNPVYTAKHVATLDWLSGGRFDLTIGIGWSREEFEACSVPWEERGARAEEYVEVMRRLWRDPVSEFSGRFYTLPACRQYPKPVQRPHPPLWFGGWSEAALDRTARLGDGWYGFDMPADAVAGHVARLREMLDARSRPARAVKISCGGYSVMPRTLDALAEYKRAGVEQFVFSLTETNREGMLAELDLLAHRFIGKL
ncbi:MAG TPA: LLM class F420-dependent oxidoreductase [Alphaproteobacteria bacterium]|nr:LLM class F420-dependent oxidoreductase [Alphaproteobacteria bacterium]